MQEDRMNNILLWTILGWTVCGICSFVSYNMAKEDLVLMAEGVMDNRNESTVKMMKTISLVHLILMVVSLGCVCLGFGAQMLLIGSQPSYGGY